MKAKTVKETLIAAKWILENVGWCQHHYILGEGSCPLHLGQAEAVHNICILGAISMTNCSQPSFQVEAVNILTDLVSNGNIAEWNDKSNRTKQQVFQLMDKAIKIASTK